MPEVTKDDSKKNEAAASSAQSAPAASSKRFYFMSDIAGLTVNYGIKDQARFQPYQQTVQGDKVKVGFLTTDDPVLVKRLKADANVFEISAEKYKENTGEGSVRVGY